MADMSIVMEVCDEVQTNLVHLSYCEIYDKF